MTSLGSRDRAGVLHITVWQEGDDVALRMFRARITQRLDVQGPEESTDFARTVDEVLAQVDDWLHRFVGDIPSGQ
ncbi:hypothetical protein ACWF0M_00590 [Kribbella sp. NPDC055110]